MSIIIDKNREEHKKMLGLALSDVAIDKPSEEDNEDIRTMKECLFELQNRGESGGFLPIINFRNNSLAFRLMVPVMGALGMNVFVSGTGELAKTPFEDVIETMTPMGCEFRFDHFPFELSGELKSGNYAFDENSSADFISGLMMALPIVEGHSKIIIKNDYDDMRNLDNTVVVVKGFGVSIEKTDEGFSIKGGQRYCKEIQ